MFFTELQFYKNQFMDMGTINFGSNLVQSEMSSLLKNNKIIRNPVSLSIEKESSKIESALHYRPWKSIRSLFKYFE